MIVWLCELSMQTAQIAVTHTHTHTQAHTQEIYTEKYAHVNNWSLVANGMDPCVWAACPDTSAQPTTHPHAHMHTQGMHACVGRAETTQEAT